MNMRKEDLDDFDENSSVPSSNYDFSEIESEEEDFSEIPSSIKMKFSSPRVLRKPREEDKNITKNFSRHFRTVLGKRAYSNSSINKSVNLNLSKLSQLSNSKAIVSALKSLQNKIKRISKERDYYKRKFEQEVKLRKAAEKDMGLEKIQMLKEKEDLLKNRNNISEKLSRFLKIQSIDKNLKNKTMEYVTNKSSKKDNLLDVLQDQKIQMTKRIIELKREVENLKKEEGIQRIRVKELSRMLVNQKRKTERIQSRNLKINKTMDDILDFTVHQIEDSSIFSPRKKGNMKGKIKSNKDFKSKKNSRFPKRSKISSQVSRISSRGNNTLNKVNKRVRNKKPSVCVSNRSKSVGKSRFLNYSHRVLKNSSNNSKIGEKKKKKSTWTRILGVKRGDNMQKRLTRANLNRKVPFIRDGGSNDMYNVNSLIQKGIQMNTRARRKKKKGNKFKVNLRGNGKIDKETKKLVAKLKYEYSNLVKEYRKIVSENRGNELDVMENLDIKEKLRNIAELIRKKEMQIDFLEGFKKRKNSKEKILVNQSIPDVRGAKRRIDQLKLFNKLKKNVLEITL